MPWTIANRQEELRALSRIARGYAKYKDSNTQEFQALFIDDDVILSSNLAGPSGEVASALGDPTRAELHGKLRSLYDTAKDKSARIDFPVEDGDLKKVGSLLDSMGYRRSGKDHVVVTCADPPRCASALTGKGRLIILTGQMTNQHAAKWHAEQSLLRSLALRLKDNEIPEVVALAGVKVPCKNCFDVLTRFRKAYQKKYNRSLNEFDDTSASRRTEATVQKLSLTDLRSGAPTLFQQFVNEFHNPT